MKKLPLFILAFLSIALAVAPPGQASRPAPANLAALMPVGSLLCVQSPYFAAVLHDWENSQEKLKWLASDNYQVFSRSRLFQRLQDAQAEFATAAGAPPDMALLHSVAGDQSALALYDVGNLQFLYITHLPSARAMQNVLWSNREKFEPRKAGDAAYYVRTDSNRVVAFAVSGDYLLLATREDLMVSALGLLAGQSLPSLQDESWYRKAVAAAGTIGDLRMVLNMPALVKSPHFRSYWVEQNITELKAYSAEVADLHRTATEIREDRVLLKAEGSEVAQASPGAGVALAELLSKVPEQGGIYRAWSAPSADAALDLLMRKILAPHSGTVPPSPNAPEVALGSGVTGSESDLETRIDVAPVEGMAGAPRAEALQKLLKAHPLEADLEYQSLQNIALSPLVRLHSAVVIRGSANWDAAAARGALREAIGALYTVSQIGVSWHENHAGSASYFQLDGLVPLAVAVQGPILLVADSAESLQPLLTNSHAVESAPNLTYAAGFRHDAERENIVRMMRLIESPVAAQNAGVPGQPGREPLFFSENLASLSQSLQSVESESVAIEDRGSELQQRVIYRLKARPATP